MSTLQKIILVRDDEVRVLEGEEAERWDREVTGIIIFGSVHSACPNLNQFNWQVFKKVSEEE